MQPSNKIRTLSLTTSISAVARRLGVDPATVRKYRHENAPAFGPPWRGGGQEAAGCTLTR